MSWLDLYAVSSWQDIFRDEDTLAIMIPILAIVVGGLVAIAHILIRHRERMAMIERGMHPDHPPEEVEFDASAEPAPTAPTQAYRREPSATNP